MNRPDEIDIIIEREEKLMKYSGEDQIVLSYDLLDILHEERGKRHDVEMKSGIPHLDAAIISFLCGELITISGPTKHGKTLFAQTLTKNFVEQGHTPLWFTYEVPAYQFLQQFGDQLPSFVLPKILKDNSLSWIIERIHEAKLKYKITSVFIDNTQNIVNLNTPNLSQVMGELFKILKRTAMQMNIAVFILHHMAKLKIEPGEEMNSSMLRDSSMVAQTSDTVLFVWRDKDTIINPNKSYLKVTENRRYGVFNHITALRKIGPFLYEERS